MVKYLVLALLTCSLLVIAGCVALAQSSSAAAVPLNDCSDPHWETTLRCELLDRFPTSQAPQPNLRQGPGSRAELGSFTRVFLTANSNVRCLDGTVPAIYVDKGVCTEPSGCGGAGYGEPVDSNQWIFSLTGGGACNAQDTDHDGVVDSIQSCLDNYLTEMSEMGTAYVPAMRNEAGVNSPDPQSNPVFAGYNRVRFQKCSYDRYMGRRAYTNTMPGGYFTGTIEISITNPITVAGIITVNVDLYQQGFRIMEEALLALRDGMTYTTWIPDSSGGITSRQEALPPLVAADTILIVGHSGGAHGLLHNIDRLADGLRSWPQFDGDVRGVIDANFLPSIENEAAFQVGAPVTTTQDAYSDIWSGETEAEGQVIGYDGQEYLTNLATEDYFRLVEQYASWAARFDQSCSDAHDPADRWKCRDRYHVLFNHISTPLFIREDFSDPNIEHTNRGDGHRILWGEGGSYDCPVGEASCPPRWEVPGEYRPRLENQVGTLLNRFETRAALARGVDSSLGSAGDVPTFYLWMPDCGSHGGAYGESAYNDTYLQTPTFSISMREWLEEFVGASRTNVMGWRIDEWQDSSGHVMASICPS